MKFEDNLPPTSAHVVGVEVHKIWQLLAFLKINAVFQS